MQDDEIIREAHRVKEQLAAQFERDPKAYWAELKRIHAQWQRRPSPKPPKRRKAS